MNWKKLLIPFWPGKGDLGSVGISTNSKLGEFLLKLWSPILDIAGIAVNLATAYVIFLFFNNFDLTNYFHIFIFLLGFEPGIMGVFGMKSFEEGADLNSFFKTFKINIHIKTIIITIVIIAILIFFKNYYINQFIELLGLIGQNNFHWSFTLPF